MAHYPSSGNFTSIKDVFTYVNLIGEGWTMTVFIVTLHVVFFAFMKSKGNGTFESLVATTYLMSVVVGVFFAMGVIPSSVAIFYGVLMGSSIVMQLANKK